MTETATKQKARPVVKDPLEAALLKTDEDSLLLLHSSRLDALDKKMDVMSENVNTLWNKSNLATFLQSNITEVAWTIIGTILALSFGSMLVIWMSKPGTVSDPEKICSYEANSNQENTSIRKSLVIAKKDGTVQVMEVGDCASLVEMHVPKPPPQKGGTP